jgi:phosphoglycerate dehydrogenase-like enzyme
MIIAIDSAIPYIRGVFEPWAEVRYCDVIGREEAAEADVLIVRTRTRCDEALLGGSRVRMVASATVGTDHIDTDYCRRAGIAVANAPGSNARGVLQWVAAALADASVFDLVSARSNVLARAQYRRARANEHREVQPAAVGRRQAALANTQAEEGARALSMTDARRTRFPKRSALDVHEHLEIRCVTPQMPLRKCVLGVVGVGHVGSLVAEYAQSWGFEVLCCDPARARAGQLINTSTNDNDNFRLFSPRNFVDLEELASRADIITFHTPLTFEGEDATFHLAGEDFFSKVKRGALILNSSRGEVVDTRAAMHSECDFCIDTWEDEPHIDGDFLSRALLATPHIAGYSVQGKANATAAVVRAVARAFGLPLGDWYPHEVTPTVPRPISWEELQETITGYFDIAAETRALKSTPENFERFRNNYRFREEYF